jgi:hypothetical protein
LVAVILSGCGTATGESGTAGASASPTGHSYRVPGGSATVDDGGVASPPPQPSFSVATQQLSATGETTATLIDGHAGAGFTCTPTPDGSLTVGPITGSSSAGTWSIQMTWDQDYTGPGSYTEGVTTTVVLAGKGYRTTPPATITVNADQMSGTIDAALFHDGDNVVKEHVTGTWRCPGKAS